MLAAAVAATLSAGQLPAPAVAPLELVPGAVAPLSDMPIPHSGDAESVVDTGADKVERMTVAVFLNDQGPFDFVVDTGANRTVISSALAQRLMLPAGQRARIHDIAGVDGVQTAMVDRLRVGKRQVANMVMPLLAAENLGADGILGIDGLADQLVDIDIPGAKMTINPSRKAELRRDNAETIVVKARRRFGQLILADARIGGEKVYVIVDSGAQYSVGNNVLKQRLMRGRSHARPTPITLVGVTGRSITADLAVTPSMRIGGMTMKDVPIAFSDAHPFRQFGLDDQPAMLLGMDLLRSFDRVSLDFEQKKVRFRLRQE